ncbi:hypothetical protein COV24_04845 [candidate division WWE3 bacterium CG10_big_fil_rev_8_21_14_0_10_32_10]|uniref:Uncharacterized protein n=1 Tax=candidate division WWE3 bacterium CG10_big_fil_rev_8_21_14_0_10_32_10 TaxID=1975090 RepID=A0A2H0RAF9_UNCKA|nr:MAG: hypothetical protein COV24_04845 [candidate division WWE3 bacterium CG10_big_fil_rev_8_21_14_0_10_32_10]
MSSFKDLDLGIGKLLGINNISDLFNLLINTFFVFGVSLALLFVIISGIKWITSNGDPTKAQEARQTLTNSIIGLIIVVSFMTIVNVVLSLIGSKLNS